MIPMVFVLFPILQLTCAVCDFNSIWNGNSFKQKEIGIFCRNTSIEDYTYELFELGTSRQTDFRQLSIVNSNFSSITYLTNPIKLRNMRYNFQDFSRLALNYCAIKTIVGNAFKDFNYSWEIDLGFNDIENLDFVSYLPRSVNKLNLSNNDIKHLNFDLFIVNLNSLDLSFNKIMYLTITGYIPVRKHLLLNNNNITVIELHQSLESRDLEINLANNDIKYLDHNNTNFNIFKIYLKLLNLSHSLSDLKMLFDPKVNYKVEMIVLANNKLLQLDQNYTLTYSQHVDFSNCSLSSIQSATFHRSIFNTLNFSHNFLTLLTDSLFLYSRIEILDLSYNNIEDVNLVFEYSSIVNLNLSYNNISNLNPVSFKNMTYVYNLDLSFNQLKLNENIFVNCKNMRNLNLASNNISQIDDLAFGGLNQLVTLNLENNSVKTLNAKIFVPFSIISEINLSNNKLTTIQKHLFNSLPLKSLVLSGNDIQTIEDEAFNNLTNIKRIEINENSRHLSIKSGAFSRLPNMNEITLTHSNIREIHLRIFSEVPNLKFLDVRNNNLSSIDFSNHSEYMNIEEMALTLTGNLKMKSFLRLLFLKKLTLWNSRIRHIENRAFQGLFNLQVLEISNAEINNMENGALNGLFAVKYFDVKNIIKGKRTLRSLTFKNLHSMEILDLTAIGLEKIMPSAFEGLYSLTELYLNHNKLTSFQNFTFFGLENLFVLNLSHNYINVLKRNGFKGLKGLNSLNLNNNKINDMELGALQNFPHLQVLSMAQNNLTEFKMGAFSNLYELEILDLQRNSISSLPLESFLPLTSLKHLNLEFNNLKTIGHLPLVSNLKFLKRVGIARNKWKCEYLGNLLITFRNFGIDYSSEHLNFDEDNIEGIHCIDVCKFLLCLQDSHGIN